VQTSFQSALHYQQLCLNHCVICCVLSHSSFCENLPPTSKWCPRSKVKVNVLDWCDNLRIWDLSKGAMSWAEVRWHYGKNESSMCSTGLTALHSEHAQHRADRCALRACAAQGWPLCTPSMRSTGLTALHSEHAQHSVDGWAPWALWFAQPLSPWIHSPADTKGLLYCIWFFKPWIWAGATLSKEAFLAHPPGQGFTQSHSQCHIPHR
jgi:hypothetical protein